MKRIPREAAKQYAFDWRQEPVVTVSCGESFEVETYDASTGYFRSEKDTTDPRHRPGYECTPPLFNPVAGPIWLQDAAPGDTLVVVIEDILVDETSWIAIGPDRGPLGASTRWPELSSVYRTMIFPHSKGQSGTTRDGTLHFNKHISWPITPFIGTLGWPRSGKWPRASTGRGHGAEI